MFLERTVNNMKKSIIDITLVNFSLARDYSERNRYSKTIENKHILLLSKKETPLLNDFLSRNLSSLDLSEKSLYQKLYVKKAIYQAINMGKSVLNLKLLYPLLDSTYTWIKKEGYAIHIKSIDFSYYSIDENGRCQFHKGSIESPDRACNYTILW